MCRLFAHRINYSEQNANIFHANIDKKKIVLEKIWKYYYSIESRGNPVSKRSDSWLNGKDSKLVSD